MDNDAEIQVYFSTCSFFAAKVAETWGDVLSLFV